MGKHKFKVGDRVCPLPETFPVARANQLGTVKEVHGTGRIFVRFDRPGSPRSIWYFPHELMKQAELL